MTNFLMFSQTDSKDAIMEDASPLKIYALTVLEDEKINHTEQEGDYFIYCMN